MLGFQNLLDYLEGFLQLLETLLFVQSHSLTLVLGWSYDLELWGLMMN